MIKRYQNKVFTHEGQSTVEDFGKEILAMKDEIGAVENLTVYVGYHGDTNGDWDHDFNESEKKKTEKIGNLFPKAKLVWIAQRGLTNLEIKNAFNKGNVFFTWCDSDIKIRSVMGKK